MKTVLIGLFSLLLAGNLAEAQQLRFSGEGSAVVISEDVLGAEKLAYTAARNKAITSAIQSFLKKDSQDEINFNLKKAEILNGPMDFVLEEKKVSQKRDGKLLTIVVEVAIDTAKFGKMLGQEGLLAEQTKSRKQREFPSTMVIVSEEIGGRNNPNPYSATAIRGRFLEQDFDLVDENLVQRGMIHDQAVQAVLNGNLKAAQSVSLQYGAGIIVKGKSVAQESALKSGGMQVYGANVHLELIKADTGQILAVASADGSYPHINAMTGSRRALEEAAEKAADELLSRMDDLFEQTTDLISMSISNISFSQLAILKQILQRDFPVISQIKQRNFSGGVAILDVQLEAGATGFADQVALKDFGTFTLDVVSFSPAKMDLLLKMK
jgi:hypothetical protein